MNKGLFGFAISLIFVLLGISLITDADWNLPQGDFTIRNYVGILVVAFFGTLFILGLIKLFSANMKVK
jgi:hypothetical protein